VGIDRKEVKGNEDSLECKICGKQFKNLISLSRHVKRSHSSVSTEDYYNLYLRTNNDEGLCTICKIMFHTMMSVFKVNLMTIC